MNDLEQFEIKDVNNTDGNNYGKAIGISNTTIDLLKKQPFLSVNVTLENPMAIIKESAPDMQTQTPVAENTVQAPISAVQTPNQIVEPVVAPAPVMNATPVNTDIKLSADPIAPVVPKFVDPTLENVPVTNEVINPLNTQELPKQEPILEPVVPNIDNPFEPKAVEDPTIKKESKFNVDIPLIDSNEEKLDPIPLVNPQFKPNETMETAPGEVVIENKFVVDEPKPEVIENPVENIPSPEPEFKPEIIEEKTTVVEETVEPEIKETNNVELEEALENIKKIAHDSIDQIFAELSKVISKSSDKNQNMDLVNQSIDDGMKKLNEVINVPSQPIENNSFKL